MSVDGFSKNKLDFLMKAIDDAQNTIRFTDAKAGAVVTFWGVLFTVLNNTKSEWYHRITGLHQPLDLIFVWMMLLVSIFFLLGSVWLSISVLIPKSAPTNHIDTTDLYVDGLFFLHETTPSPIPLGQLFNDDSLVKLRMTGKEYLKKIRGKTDLSLGIELIVELQKVSFIRQMKIVRVNRAILFVRYFLTVVVILGIYFFTSQIAPFHGGHPMIHTKFNVELFIVLYIAHKVADYLFQTDKQAVMKSTNVGYLLRHCTLYTIVLTGAAYWLTGYFHWATTIGLFASHLVLDNRTFEEWWAKTVKRIPDPKNPKVETAMLELDQAFHYLVLFIICLFT